MTDTQLARRKDNAKPARALYLAFELSSKWWRLAFSDGSTKQRYVSVEGGRIDLVGEEIRKAKRKYSLPADCRVVSCYEAGRDGFWIHRELEKMGVENRVIDSSSIEVDRRARHAKTDRIDERKLLALLIRHEERGDVLRIVNVPPPAIEDERRRHRERERLQKEQTDHNNRIKALLALHGIRLKYVKRTFEATVSHLRQPDGKPLPVNLSQELAHEAQRLDLVRSQIQAIEQKQAQHIASKPSRAAAVAGQLLELRGVGQVTATTLSGEFFAWRQFNNRRQVGGAAGLTDTPYNSGDAKREQGISKSGNSRVRKLAIELAWGWLRYQPDSRLTLWYQKKWGSGSKRMRRIGIVALARRLLIELWRFVDFGLVPQGAALKAEPLAS